MQLVLITGFLGSGKTTLLMELLQAYQEKKIGVLMNEFGEIGIDGQLIKGGDFDLLELNNGSVFCACLKENFIKGLAEFLTYDLDLVFIESSGVADPSNMEKILETVTAIAKKTYDYLGSVCMIDALYFLKQFEVITALKKQIAYANQVIINKVDLQKPEILIKIEKKINAINPEAKIYQSSFCELPFKEMISKMTGERKSPELSSNTWESRPKTSVLKTSDVLDFQKFGAFFQEIKFSAHRIKGFVKTNAGNYALSAVNDFAVMTSWDKPLEKTEIVFISSVGIKIISDLLALWKKYFDEIRIEI